MNISLLSAFPPPRYLQMPAFGIDISDEALKFIELVSDKDGLHVGVYGSKAIPKGVIVSGEVKKIDELVEFLRDACKPIGMRHIYLTLPEEKGYMNIVELPPMGRHEIRTALETQFSEYVPMPFEESVFDFEVLHAKDSHGAKRLEVAMISFPRGLVQTYYDAVIQAGLIPLAFDAEVHALSRAIIPKEEWDPFLIIDFGKTRTTFIIIHERQVRFTSTVPVAGRDMNRIIADILSVPAEEAEKAKKENANIIDVRNKKLFDAVLPIVSAIRGELERYILFWETHTPGLHGGQKYGSIKKIFLCGGDANLIGLPEYLAHNIHIPVERANVWVNCVSLETYIPDITFRESLTYGSAIGAALRSFSI